MMGIFHRRHEERKRAIIKLRENKRKLAASNADLLQFTNIAAHHLQEPTRRIISFVQQLKNELKELNTSNEEIAFSLNFIEQSAVRQRALARDIQIYLTATQPRAVVELVRVATILTKVLEHRAPLINQIEAKIEYDNLFSAVIDRPRLYDIFNILLDNALHYCRPDRIPEIHIYAKKRGQRIYYYIEDNGIGIPVEYRERVFLVFERLQVNKNQNSTGIGLSIVRRIVESCNGSVNLTESPNGGTTVIFDLPAKF
jgi:light-regulated signal transduction histidine kinase (bacteriophytochrome)